MKFVSLFFTLSLAVSTWSLGAMEGNDNKQQEQLDKALYEAAERGDVNFLKQLVARGAHVDVVIKGCTALMRAAAMGHAECLHILIENGGDMSFKNATGASALSVAFERRQLDCIYVLFDAAIQIPIRNFMKSNNLGLVDKFAALPESVVKTQLKEKIMLLLLSRKYKIGDFSHIPKPLIVMIGKELTKEFGKKSVLADFHPTKLLDSQLALIFQIIDYLNLLVENVDEMNAVVAESVWFKLALLSNACLASNALLEEYKQLIDLKTLYLELGKDGDQHLRARVLSLLSFKSQKFFCTKNYEEKNQSKSTCHIF